MTGSVKSYDHHNTTTRSTVSSFLLDDEGDHNEKVKQLRRNFKRIREERDKIGEEYEEIKHLFEESEAARKKLLDEKKGLETQVQDLLGGQDNVDTLRGRIIELQRENGQLKVDSERFKKSKAEMRTENEKLTDYLAKAIDERDEAKKKLSDTELELRTVTRRLDDEITIATYQREQAEKESKPRSEEIARLKEHCRQLEIELHAQRQEFAAQLRTKNDEINRLTNEWMNSERRKEGGERKLKFADDSLNAGNNSSGLDASKDNSTAENSKMEDLDDFFAVIQQNRRMSMKEQSANPEVLFADNPDLAQSPLRTTGGSKRSKSPKSPKPNLLRRMSSMFFPQ